ncbi:hypothetical protein HMN09_00362800 [Mycena chlorophos]|uniref:Uncharacterized protein n=1 Tax=Mycena chlorophos TaxID=658473 RepID=A0A8H6WKY2_MYCCL|nr:hypothetical protein HMN09_00362800 [Mycena chlorophos]
MKSSEPSVLSFLRPRLPAMRASWFCIGLLSGWLCKVRATAISARRELEEEFERRQTFAATTYVVLTRTVVTTVEAPPRRPGLLFDDFTEHLLSFNRHDNNTSSHEHWHSLFFHRSSIQYPNFRIFESTDLIQSISLLTAPRTAKHLPTNTGISFPVAIRAIRQTGSQSDC